MLNSVYCTAYDAYGNSWDITSQVSWGVSAGAGGSWSSNTCTSDNMGDWTVTASYNGVQGTAQLSVYYIIDFYHTNTVNFNDILYFVSAYINYHENGVYNPACDLNHDGTINFNDILLFVGYYEAWGVNH